MVNKSRTPPASDEVSPTAGEVSPTASPVGSDTTPDGSIVKDGTPRERSKERRVPRLPQPSPSQQEALAAAQRAVSAASDAHQAASDSPGTPMAVRTLTKKALSEAEAAFRAVQSPKRSQRQPTADFLQMLGEEAVEAVEDSVQEVTLHAERQLRQAKSFIEDHYNIDQGFRMLGPMHQDANLSRDLHDWFNLVALIPVVFLNFANWSCPFIFSSCPLNQKSFLESRDIPGLWTGEIFQIFWWCTAMYFVADLLWVILIPNCVKSPGVIIKHHCVTLLYIMIPKLHPEYGWIMGACMIVEVNTWFLIARRALNKKGDKMFSPGVPWWKSMRLMTVSVCFYVTWFVIRLVFYPLLFFVVLKQWWIHSQVVGRYINIIAITPVMQLVFVQLNVKWSIDLMRSKLKGRGASKGL